MLLAISYFLSHIIYEINSLGKATTRALSLTLLLVGKLLLALIDSSEDVRSRPETSYHDFATSRGIAMTAKRPKLLRH